MPVKQLLLLFFWILMCLNMFNQSQFSGGFLVYIVLQQLQMFFDRFVIKINDLLTKIVTKICRFVPNIHGNLLPLVSGFHILWCSLVVSLVHWSDWIQWTRKMMYSSWFLENGRSTRTNLGSPSGYVYLFHTEIPKIMAYLDSINMNARLNASHSNFKHLSQAFFWVQNGHNNSPHGIFPRLVSLHMFCSFLLSSGLFMIKPSLFPALTDPDKKARVVIQLKGGMLRFVFDVKVWDQWDLWICFDFLVFPFRMIPKNAIQEFRSPCHWSVWCLRFCCWLNWCWEKVAVDAAFLFRRVLPVGVAFATSLNCSNVAYEYVSWIPNLMSSVCRGIEMSRPEPVLHLFHWSSH